MAEQPIIMLRDAVKAFGGVVALDYVSLDFMSGTCTALIGPNGCGKTTLFNVISGYLGLDGGQLWVNGKLVVHTKPFQLARTGVGRTFQEGRVWKEMSVLDNIVIGTRWLRHGRRIGFRRADRQERTAAAELADEVGLDHALLKYPVGALPLTGRRRVELARALALNPAILLMDELAAGLNPVESKSIFRLLAGVRRSRPRLVVVAIEHKLDVVIDASDRVLFMGNGRIVLDTSADDIRTNRRVVDAYWSSFRGKEGALQ